MEDVAQKLSVVLFAVGRVQESFDLIKGGILVDVEDALNRRSGVGAIKLTGADVLGDPYIEACKVLRSQPDDGISTWMVLMMIVFKVYLIQGETRNNVFVILHCFTIYFSGCLFLLIFFL